MEAKHLQKVNIELKLELQLESFAEQEARKERNKDSRGACTRLIAKANPTFLNNVQIIHINGGGGGRRSLCWCSEMEPQAHQLLEKVEEDDRRKPKSNRRCWCCLLLTFLLLGSVVVIPTASILVLRPKKPVFALHSIRLQSFKLDVTSSKEIHLPPTTASLSFSTRNPNKIGIRYRSTELELMSGGIPVGAIRVPNFYQPPRNENVSVIMHVTVHEQLDLTELLRFNSSGGSSPVEIQIVGCIGASTRIMNFPSPKIKISLDCKLRVDYDGFAIYKGISSLTLHKALLLSNLPHISQKCSFSLCV